MGIELNIITFVELTSKRRSHEDLKADTSVDNNDITHTDACDAAENSGNHAFSSTMLLMGPNIRTIP